MIETFHMVPIVILLLIVVLLHTTQALISHSVGRFPFLMPNVRPYRVSKLKDSNRIFLNCIIKQILSVRFLLSQIKSTVSFETNNKQLIVGTFNNKIHNFILISIVMLVVSAQDIIISISPRSVWMKHKQLKKLWISEKILDQTLSNEAVVFRCWKNNSQDNFFFSN